MRRIVSDRGLENEFEIDSAGTYGGHAGQLPDARMRAAASRRGYELTHRSRPLREEDFDAFDLIVVVADALVPELLEDGCEGLTEAALAGKS